jgi:hypothetical protein
VKKALTAVVLGAAAALAVTALASGAARDTYMVGAKLTAKAEVPAPKGAPAAAKGSFTGDYVENSKGAVLTWKLSFSGLSGPGTAAHIHMGKPGVAGPVIVPLCGPCKASQSGKATISKSVIAALEGGKAYVNVHTAKNAAGEIRGQVKVSG